MQNYYKYTRVVTDIVVVYDKCGFFIIMIFLTGLNSSHRSPSSLFPKTPDPNEGLTMSSWAESGVFGAGKLWTLKAGESLRLVLRNVQQPYKSKHRNSFNFLSSGIKELSWIHVCFWITEMYKTGSPSRDNLAAEMLPIEYRLVWWLAFFFFLNHVAVHWFIIHDVYPARIDRFDMCFISVCLY